MDTLAANFQSLLGSALIAFQSYKTQLSNYCGNATAI
jgi:hypothetical protein